MLIDKYLEDLKSKDYCQNCRRHKLTDNVVAKGDVVAFHYCASCNFQYRETEDSKKFYDKKNEDKTPAADQPWGGGGLVLVVMLLTILIIQVYSRQEQTETVQPVGQMIEVRSRLRG